ncbi:helix-turn-helix domain-containing protein [Lacrimispora aerotolerans]|uniref:helix-turn-helix domain-containing protein n=1 Tax=Lacrimispora aerotolerans TaxID=36832 RepID=UPI00068FFE4A|nr:helix-turn-helix transcriptional regulator [Lacrimispora aerotolerans]
MSITGQRIKARRKQLKMSADEVAAKLGVSRSTIFRYENGQIEKVPANVLERLAEILKTTPTYLMGWDDDSNASSSHKLHDLSFENMNPEDRNISMVKESSEDTYQIDERLRSLNVEPADKDTIIKMAEIYMLLTDEGRKKAYDYIVDLSEHTKYLK